jgi:hypothetical protein
MREDTKLHSKFLKFSLSYLEIHRLQVGFLLSAFTLHQLMINFILPFCGGSLVSDVITGKNTGALLQIVVMGTIYLLAKVVLYVSDFFIRNYLGNLARNFKRNMIKFLINNGKNLNNERSRLEVLTEEITNVFFRSLVQLAPSAIVFIVVFCCFLANSLLYFIPIGGYIVYSLTRRMRVGSIAMVRAQKKRYLRQNSAVDDYIERNRFWGNADDFVYSLDIFLHEGNAVIPDKIDDKKDKNIVQPMDVSGKNLFRAAAIKFINDVFRSKKKEIYFIPTNVFVFVVTNMSNITFVKAVLLLFFTSQIIFLLKIVINTHHLNIRSINNIKKQLDRIDSKKNYQSA